MLNRQIHFFTYQISRTYIHALHYHFYYRVSNSFQPLTPVQSPLQSALYGIAPARPKMLSIVLVHYLPCTAYSYTLGRSRSPTMLKHYASIICVVAPAGRVARYRKCFYAFLFRRPRGEKYRNNSVWKQHLALP